MNNNAQPIIKKISDVYAHLLPDFFNSPFPNEEYTTCDNCPMCVETSESSSEEEAGFANKFNTFYPDIKCCTFYPNLPNFLVGAILPTTKTELLDGQQRIKRKVIEGAGVSPQAVRSPVSYSKLYQECSDYTFGRNRSLLCPYYNLDKKNCSIWPFRQVTCATYFCKSVEGITGSLFWERVNHYISNFENILANYALQRLGLTIENDIKSSSEKNSNAQIISPELSDTNWDSWKGRKIEFYIQTFNIINGLDRHDFDEICGTDLSDALEQVKIAYAEAIQTTVPERLRMNPALQYKLLSDNKYHYDTGNGSCILSSRVHNILRFFDGKKDNKQVVECIVKEQNINLSSSFLLRLYKNKILI